MGGTVSGGIKSSIKVKQTYGEDFFKAIGSLGGLAPHSKPRGFAANRQLASLAGTVGGMRSRRGSAPRIKNRKLYEKVLKRLEAVKAEAMEERV